MKIRRIEVIEPPNLNITAKQVFVGYNRKYGGPVITQTASEIAKLILRAAYVQKYF